MTAQDPESGAVFDVENLRRLIELMEQHDLREMDLQQEGRRVRLKRGMPEMSGTLPMLPAMSPPTAAAGSAAPPPSAAAEEAGEHIVTISSPMVGTYYCRPNPNAAAYVKLGDTIEPDTTVCIIEAMKVFNEIPAEVRGKIVAILVDDEEPVDFGRPLFKVDTRG